MRTLTALGRMVRVAMHLIGGLLVVLFTFPRLSPEQRDTRVQVWARDMLQCLGIQLVMHGCPPTQGPVLLVANHISWLDIVVLHAARHCRFVSKADVQRWPVVGRLATAAGTLYIERESRRDALRTVHRMVEALQAGDVLAVFPEGTTGEGHTVLPFHANLLQAAISAQAPVQPVALQFANAKDRTLSLAPCYVGDDTLLQSVWRTLRGGGLQAIVRFGEAQYAQNRDRRTWAADLHAAVVALRAEESGL